MKKKHALALALLLALSLLTACGGNGGDGGTKDDTDPAKDFIEGAIDTHGGGTQEERDEVREALGNVKGKWPADKLPDGLPVYPDGEIVTTVTVDGVVTTAINDTSEDSLQQYMETLKNEGWSFSDDSALGSFGMYEAVKGEWKVSLRLINETAIRIACVRI